MDVSIIIPLYRPDPELLQRIQKSLDEQEFSRRKEVLFINNGGLAQNINKGIRKARYGIVVVLEQDCIPSGKSWLQNLTEPLKEEGIVASVSRVHLPEDLWKRFDVFARALTLHERGPITPLMDEKGCAFNKSALQRLGLFNEKDFRTAGEDFDMYLKLRSAGKIVYPDCEIIHVHPTRWKQRLFKNYQYANGYGALVRKYKRRMPRWYAGIIKSTPILGMLAFSMSYPFRRGLFLYPFYLLLTPILHFMYVWAFWKGFLSGRQTV